MPKDELVEKVARAIEQPFLPHGYELKPHLLKAAAKAAISALQQDGEVERLRAENERLSKAVVGGILGELLTEDETEALVAFVKSLRSPEDRSLRVGGE